ncbi:MAG: hypothetical protein HQM06_04300 [Magnetococcales bacterium]|nr:hypothetical protein [Magnetococcales bacterium]
METTERNEAAWVVLHLPGYGPESIVLLLQRLEHLFRLNPFLRLESWQAEEGALVEGWRVRMRFFNEMNGLHSTRQLTWHPLPHGWRMDYDSGWKKAVQLTWEPYADNGLALTLQEFYHPPVAGENAPERSQEIDHSLFAWGKALRNDFVWRRRLRWVPGSSWYLDWLATLPPSQRRITRLLVWSSLLELLLLTTLLWFFPAG